MVFLKTGTVLSSICLGSVSFAFGFISVTSSMKASKQQEDFALAPPKSPEDLALEEQAKRFSAFYRGTELSSPESSAQPQPDHDEYKKNLADQQKQKQLHDSSPVSSVSFRLTPRLKPLPDRGWQLTSLLTPQNRLPVLERDRKSLGLEQTFTTDHFAYAASQTKERRCLAEAIYYEARSESTTGQMAVAEVVLNRVRHRAYPMTICDVVYQGSWKGKGCQVFLFPVMVLKRGIAFPEQPGNVLRLLPCTAFLKRQEK